MAITIQILETNNAPATTVEVAVREQVQISNTAQSVNVNSSNDVPAVLEVLAGIQGPPGAQNLFVGPTPPANPQTNWVWIDTS